MFTEQEKNELQEMIEKAIHKKDRITKEEIRAIKDREKRQRLIAENMDLFINNKER